MIHSLANDAPLAHLDRVHVGLGRVFERGEVRLGKVLERLFDESLLTGNRPVEALRALPRGGGAGETHDDASVSTHAQHDPTRMEANVLLRCTHRPRDIFRDILCPAEPTDMRVDIRRGRRVGERRRRGLGRVRRREQVLVLGVEFGEGAAGVDVYGQVQGCQRRVERMRG